MRFFIAGIMQGSHPGAVLHPQDYRGRLRCLLQRHCPEAEIYDPLSDHENSLSYDDVLARQVFYRHNRLCREVDVVVAFVPEASMGTAIEMWEAHEHGRGMVIAISPLARNWAVRFCSHLVFPDWVSFETELASGLLVGRIREFLARQRGAVTP